MGHIFSGDITSINLCFLEDRGVVDVGAEAWRIRKGKIKNPPGLGGAFRQC